MRIENPFASPDRSASIGGVSYQVFARKYRPQTFADVLGQEHVVRTLRNAIAQDRLAHAYLFVGPRGTGKTSTARIFAKALNCPGGPSVDFDPTDELCVEIAEGRSLDVLEIDGASNNGVEQVRALRESVSYAPARSRFKIYYIDEVHMLSTAAFNALLKTLEEPPAHVKFIFATTEANKILPTIISRCQRFDLRRIPNTIIANHLLHIARLEGVDLEEKAAFAIGKGAEGGMRDAQSMLDQLVAYCGNTIREPDVLDIFGFTAVQTVSQMAQQILESDTVGALRLVHETSEAGKDLGRLLTDLIQHFRTLLVSQADTEAAAADLEPDIAAQVSVQSQMGTTEQMLRVVDGLAEVDARMRWATNKRLHFELGVIQAVQHFNEISISDVIEALDGGTTTSPPKPTPRPQIAARRAAPVEEGVSLPKPPSEPSSPPSEPAPRERTHITTVVGQASSIVAEGTSLPKSQPPPPPSEPAPLSKEMTPGEFWPALLQLMRERRPLAATWLEHGNVHSLTRGIVKLGFPTTEVHARDSLMRENQRKFLEDLATELLGQPMKFDMVLDPALKPPPVTELHFDLGDITPTSPPVPTPSPTAHNKVEPASSISEAPPAPSVSNDDPTAAANEAFRNDPLINSAIAKFKLKLPN